MPTTIWDQTQPGRPQTHVLILGVGVYPHLPGGRGKSTRLHMKLGQLTSPPESARAFADWVLSEFNNGEVPLGSVQMLLSDIQPKLFRLPDGQEITIEDATMANIKKAFDLWFGRCDDNSRNIAILYFCGHGVMIQGDLVLLASDYGENDNRPFETAFNFNKTYLGMGSCKAKIQCFFVDACRQVPIEGLNIEESGAQVLRVSSIKGRYERDAPIFLASAYDASAYGRRGEISRFTMALLKSLRGVASKKEGGKFVIKTTRLGEAINEMIERLNKKQGGPRQQSNLGGNCSGLAPIHILKTHPSIPVTLRFSPQRTLEDARLSLKSDRNPEWHHQSDPAPITWEIDEVIADQYTLTAVSRSRDHKYLQETVFVVPPSIDEPYDLEADQ
jgi:hypothetical protein